MHGYPGLEVVPERSDGLQVADHYAGRDLETAPGQFENDNDLAIRPYEQQYDHPPHIKQEGYTPLENNAITPQGRRRGIPRLWYILGAVLLLLVIIGAVVGGVLGSRSHSSSTAADSTTPSSSSTASSIHNSTGLTSIGWLNTSVNPWEQHHRVYYQLPTNEIRESAWNSTGKTWYVLNNKIAVAKSGSPLSVSLGLRSGVSNVHDRRMTMHLRTDSKPSRE